MEPVAVTAALAVAATAHVALGRLGARAITQLGRGGDPGSRGPRLLVAVVALAGRVVLWLAALDFVSRHVTALGAPRERLVRLVRSALLAPLVTLNGRGFTGVDLLLLPLLLAALWLVVSAGTALAGRHLSRAAGLSTTALESPAAVLRYVVLALGALVILQARGVDSMSLAVGASVLGVGIGFGLQRIANDFVSGLIIGLERPIAPGDYVQVGGLSGTVDRIGARGTRLVTRDRVTILVPNSRFLETEVVNWSHGDPVHQLHIQVSVAYGSPLARVRGALLEAARRHPRVLADPGPRVEMVRFGDDALELVLLVWSNEPGDQHELRSDLLFRIDSVFRRHGIQVPFPQRDVRLAAPRLEGLLLAWARRHLPAGDLAALEVETAAVEEETGGAGSWTDVDVDRLGERLRGPGGIPILDRRHRFRTYARCFLGKEAVDWIAREEQVSRAEAVALGRLLVARGVVHHVLDEHDFEDEPYFYRYFVDEEGQERGVS